MHISKHNNSNSPNGSYLYPTLTACISNSIKKRKNILIFCIGQKQKELVDLVGENNWIENWYSVKLYIHDIDKIGHLGTQKEN